MSNDSDDADRGRGGLQDRLRRIEPPADLAPRVQATLESRGLVKAPNAGGVGTADLAGARPRQADGTRAAWAFRAGLLAAGFLFGLLARTALSNSGGRPSEASVAGQYVLLLYGDTPGDTGVVHVAREQEYGRWASSLKDARWVGGHELADVVERLGPAGAPTVPPSDRLAGYFVIEAPSRERAAEVARSCPHLKYGGRVVVMSIAS